MRVRNDKAILDELTSTKHRIDSDEEMTDDKFDSKTAPNLIIQSSVQNGPVSEAAPTVEAAPIQPSTRPHHPSHPVYINPQSYPNQQVVVDKHYVHHQPVQYVEQYVQ